MARRWVGVNASKCVLCSAEDGKMGDLMARVVVHGSFSHIMKDSKKARPPENAKA